MSTDIEILERVYEVFSVDIAKKTKSCPQHVLNGVLYVACENESDIFLRRQLEILTGVNVRLEKATTKEVEIQLIVFQSKRDRLKGVSEEYRLDLVVDNGDQEITKSLADKDDEDGPIVKLLDTLITSALSKRASDIHIEGHESYVSIKYRIDGVLCKATDHLDSSIHLPLLSRLKVISELDIAERRVPQDGRFKLRQGSRSIDFRLSIIPGLWGENAVIRVLDNVSTEGSLYNRSIDDMGFSTDQASAFKKAVNEPHGMVLVTGPTGSGKTTTLYSALQSVNLGSNKIITIEDPVEYHLDGVMQIPVNIKKGLTFAKGLRSILRHDPDQILVGEIRDLETAEIAVQSALTGHLVFSSVHANSAKDVLIRMQNIGVSLENCLSALNCIVSQRLVRLNCSSCLEVDQVPEQILLENGFDPDSDPALMKSRGCERCEYTGHRGRTMIAEILLIEDTFKRSLLAGESILRLLDSTSLVGNSDMRGNAQSLCLEGKISLSEMNRVTFG